MAASIPRVEATIDKRQADGPSPDTSLPAQLTIRTRPRARIKQSVVGREHTTVPFHASSSRMSATYGALPLLDQHSEPALRASSDPIRPCQLAMMGFSVNSDNTAPPHPTPGGFVGRPQCRFKERSCKLLILNGDPGKTRTSDLRFRKPSLYPAELRDHKGFLAFGLPDLHRGRSGVVRNENPYLCQRGVYRRF